MSMACRPRNAAARPRRPVLAAAAAAAVALSGGAFVGHGVGRPASAPSRARGLSVAMRAEFGDIRPMIDASVYVTDLDPITAEVDISMIPEEMGVYAVYNDKDALQYIGLSRAISKSVANHVIAFGPAEAGRMVSKVKILEMAGESKETLKATWERWIKEHMEVGGEIPAGNLPENADGAENRWRNKGAAAVKAPLSLAGVRGIETMAEALEAVAAAVKKHPVLLFMKGSPAMPQCGFSAKTVGILKELGANFESVNIMDPVANPGVRDAVKEYSKWPTIPQLFIGGELIGGADIVADMFNSGKLQEALRNAGKSDEEKEAPSAGSSGANLPKGEIKLIEDSKRPTASKLSSLLNENFDLHALRIMDDSGSHAGDAGAMEMGLSGESHFTVEIVAPEFDGLSPVARQQKVFGVLKDLMPRIHALSLVTKTPAEMVMQ